jgi:hypothetical protein
MPESRRNYDLFISYARKDGIGFAEKLETHLRAAGYATWRDNRNLDPDQDFTAEIEHAIEQSVSVLCCITRDTKRDDSFVRREISYALALQKPVVPLIVDDCLPPIHIINVTREDFLQTPWDKAFPALLTRLGRTDEAAHQEVTPPQDPHRDYLNTLYEQIVHFLKQTVISEITLYSVSTQGAVRSHMRIALPAAFLGRPSQACDTATEDQKNFWSFGEAVSYYGSRVLLLGDPGAGKTTTMLAFAREKVADRLHNPKAPLPVILRIATWDAQHRTPIGNWIASQVPMLEEEAVASMLKRGEITLLLDGLDELGSERRDLDTKELFDPRQRFIAAIPRTGQVVVSCRIRDYTEIGKKIALRGAVTLQPLTDMQLKAYLSEVPELWKTLEADLSLRDVARTPLLLGILAHAYKDNETGVTKLRDPKTGQTELREQIFRTFVQRRFEHEQSRVDAQLPFSISEIYWVLGKAAVESMDYMKGPDHRYGIPIDQSIRKSLSDDANQFIEQALRLHLLIQDKSGELRFLHLLIRDHFGFLVAKELRMKGKGWLFFRQALPAQSVAMLAEIGDMRALDVLLEEVEAPSNRIVGPPLLFYLEKIADPRVLLAYARTLSCDARYSRWDWIADDAAKSLFTVKSKLGDELSAQTLIAAMASTSPRERADYALAIGMLRLKDGLDTLLSACGDKDPTVRGCAAWSLGSLGDEKAISALMSLRQDYMGIARCSGRCYMPWNPQWDVPTRLPNNPTVSQLANVAINRITKKVNWP